MRSNQSLIDCIADGRAVLLLGQRHTAGLVESLTHDIAAIASVPLQDSLLAQMQELESASVLDPVRRAFLRHEVQPEIQLIADCPWSLVLLSAIDPVPSVAFARPLASRRVRQIYATRRTPPITGSRNLASLTVVRLFGSVEEDDPDLIPPLTAGALRQRRAFDVAPVLQQLPYVVGDGCLVVAGVGADDWIDIETLALACMNLPAGSVHWFAEPESPLDLRDYPEFGDSLVVHTASLAETIAASADSPAGDDIRAAQMRVVSSEDRVVTHGPRGSRRQIVLSPQEWRNATQSVSVLDDSVAYPRVPQSVEAVRQLFRQFLRSGQGPPDWSSVASGFLFQRDRAVPLFQRVSDELRRIGAVNPSVGSAVVTTRRPILLVGPPGCGKTRLLHWLALRLRADGYVALFALPSGGRLNMESVERTCRLLEEKGSSGVAVIADDLDDVTYRNLADFLASVGRNAVVIGASRTTSGSSHLGDRDPRDALVEADFEPFPISSRLVAEPRDGKDSEITRFRRYLDEHGVGTSALTAAHMQDRYFLVLLYYLIPEVRGGLQTGLWQAYDRLASALDAAHQAPNEGTGAPAPTAAWQRQLLAAAAELFPGAPLSSEAHSSSPFEFTEGTREALDLALFCSRLRRPVPVDLLLRAMPTSFARAYPRFARMLSESELLDERVELDGTVVLTADHAEIARLALTGIRPGRPQQVELLKYLVDAVTWGDWNFPGDNPAQDFVVDVLQLVGPRGAEADEFGSASCLAVVSVLLRQIREDHRVQLPKLLLLEAQTLRLLSDRDEADYDESMRRTALAIEILQSAEDILVTRRPTDARNHELINVWTTRAAVHGYVIGGHLRRLSEHPVDDAAATPLMARLRSEIFSQLQEVELYVGRTRSLGMPSFFSLDVNYWSQRDVLQRLPELTERERFHLLARMASILDSAHEEPIQPRQMNRLLRRQSELAAIEGDITLSEEIAERLRGEGDFGGWCQLIRRDVYEPGVRVPRSREVARAGLQRLLSLGREVWRDREAMTLAHHLWMWASLPNGQIGADPLLAACKAEQWKAWRQILLARQSFPEDEDNAFVNFCLAWAHMQLDDPVPGATLLKELEANSVGSRRRVGALAVLTDENGVPVQFAATARRRLGDAWVVYVPRLLAESRLYPTHSAYTADMQVGTQLRFSIGLNYRGLLPWDERRSVRVGAEAVAPEARRGSRS